MSSQTSQDNGHSVHPALTSHTLTAVMQKTLRAMGGLNQLHTALASVTRSMHPVAVSVLFLSLSLSYKLAQ